MNPKIKRTTKRRDDHKNFKKWQANIFVGEVTWCQQTDISDSAEAGPWQSLAIRLSNILDYVYIDNQCIEK